MDLPTAALMDADACYRNPVDLLHPGGLARPRCGRRDGLGVHRRHRAPVLDYQCDHCGRAFDAFADAAPHRERLPCADLLLLLRGTCQGVPAARPARELGRDRGHLLALRHRMHAPAGKVAGGQVPLPDGEAEADGMGRNAGDKRHPAPRPG